MNRAWRLQPVVISLERGDGGLLERIRGALAVEGEPLRWAITAVESGPAGQRLRIEAMVIHRGG